MTNMLRSSIDLYPLNMSFHTVILLDELYNIYDMDRLTEPEMRSKMAAKLEANRLHFFFLLIDCPCFVLGN